MKAALLKKIGDIPAAAEFDRPEPQGGQELIEVEAAGLNPVDIQIADGLLPGLQLPCALGIEGIGRTRDGRRVYFDAVQQPFGSFAECCLVAQDGLMDVPDGIEAAAAMPFGIAGIAAWTGLGWKGGLREGETVLVLGASSIVGQIAVQASRRLGAGRVVAAARDETLLIRTAELGADATVRLGGDRETLVAELQEAAGGGFDLVLDLLWAEPIVAAIEAMSDFGRVVQLGASAGPFAELPARALWNRGITILAHINYHAPIAVRAEAFRAMCEMNIAGDLAVPVEQVSLDDVEDAWERQRTGPHVKLVIRP
jgi:NADPH:quinone reductase-like Zn-dependent oxidoreductase